MLHPTRTMIRVSSEKLQRQAIALKKKDAKINTLTSGHMVLAETAVDNADTIRNLRQKMEGMEERMKVEKAAVQKQSKKYYQDVEKAVREAVSDGRAQLKASKAEIAACRKSLEEKGDLQLKVAKLEQGNARLVSAVNDWEDTCNRAEEASAAITTGYEQGREEVQELQASQVELQLEVERLTQENKQLLEKRNTTPAVLASTPVVETPPTPQREDRRDTTDAETFSLAKHFKELRHMDGTITLWKNMLADAEVARYREQAEKTKLDAERDEVASQIEKLGAQKKERTKDREVPAWAMRQSVETTEVDGPRTTDFAANLVKSAPAIIERFTALLSMVAHSSSRSAPWTGTPAALRIVNTSMELHGKGKEVDDARKNTGGWGVGG